MRILIVEDNADLVSLLVEGLRRNEIAADAVSTAAEASQAITAVRYAAIVLDLLLPGLNGYGVCERLRSEGDRTPILVLTAKSGEYDQIDLLDAGADPMA